MRTKLLFTFIVSLGIFQSANAQKMNNKTLEKVLTANSDSIDGRPGYWQFKHQQVWMLAVTDENHNRMRIVTPVARVEDLDYDILEAALSANFHSVLDAKYAISDGIMWAAFIHPLKELTEQQVESAIKQIYYSSLTFGSDYSGGDLQFPNE